MDPIRDNPFRVLGLFANSSERDVVRQVGKITKLAQIGRTPDSDSDFLFLGDLERSASSVKEAAGRIEQDAKRLHWAIFWFVNNDHVDQTAINHLRNADPDKALKIWSLAVIDKPLTKKNLASALNLSTLEMALATQGRGLHLATFLRAVELKSRMLSDDVFQDFAKIVKGSSAAAVREFAISGLIDTIFGLVNGGVTPAKLPDFLAAFNPLPEANLKQLRKKLAEGPLASITAEVELAREMRNESPEDANVYGNGLLTKAKPLLAVVDRILGSNSVQFQNARNRVANEILQCSIDFFNEHSDSLEIDPGPDALKLINDARRLKPNGEVLERIEENLPAIKSWTENTIEREKTRFVRPYLDYLGALLQEFEGVTASIANAKQLLLDGKPHLEGIAQVLGRSEEIYLRAVDAVASNVMGMLVTVVNRRQERVVAAGDLVGLIDAVRDARVVMSLLGSLDLGSEARTRYSKNLRTLDELAQSLGLAKKPPRVSAQRARRPSDRTEFTPSSFDQTPIVSNSRVGAFIIAILVGIIGLGYIAVQTSKLNSNNNSNGAAKPPAGMVLVPGGTFSMGRANSKIEVESPAHQVTVKPFFMDVNETTNAEYLEFVKAKNYARPRTWPVTGPPTYKVGTAQQPVVGVTWYDAVEYAKWKGKRLPTEQEWEFAAKGTDSRLYPWGSDWAAGYANVGYPKGSVTYVGAYKKKSPFGINDMSGNAWEWTASDFRPYPGGRIPKELAAGDNLKTMRGGAYHSESQYATTTYRLGLSASGAQNYDAVGFRCVKDP